MATCCTKCGTALPETAPGAAPSPCPKCGSALPHPQAATIQYPAGTPPMRTGDAVAATDRGEWEVLPPGTLIGAYRIAGAIGQGGMGAVYRAVQSGLDRVVALKVLPAHLARDQDFIARFNREARTLAALGHPNIVGVYELGRADDRYFFCMEFVDGRSLRDFLRERKMTQDEVLETVPQICDALAYAHGEGVVHRDIKPENILLDKRGRVKIADFGLARLVRGETPIEPLTRTNTVMGTVEYMAPEQRESSRDVDARADLYSLGVVLYEMLTGALPAGRWELPSRRVNSDPRLDEVILRCLEHEPAKRFAGAAEIARAVGAIRGSAYVPPADGSRFAVPPHQESRGFPSVALPAALPGERQEVVDGLAAALIPAGFVRYGKSLPQTVPLDAVFTRAAADHYYVVAVTPWPAMTPANAFSLAQSASLGKAGILGLLAAEEASENRIVSVVFTGFPEDLADDFGAGLKKLVDRTGYHDVTVHSATAVDARAGRVLHYRSSFAYWSQRDVCEKIRLAARAACESIARHRRLDTAARGREPAGAGRLGHLEQHLLAAGYTRVWWHETRPGLEVLARTYLRPGGAESVQLVILRETGAGTRLDRRWMQNQADLLRAAIHTLAPSLRYQEFIVTLCVGGRAELAPGQEKELGRVINSLRLDPVCIQAVGFVPDGESRAWFQASRSPHYYRHNQTADLVRKAIDALPRREESAAALAPTAVLGGPAPSGPALAPPAGPSEVATTSVPAPAPPVALQKPVRAAIEVPAEFEDGIPSARFTDLVAESARFIWRNFGRLAIASVLIELVLWFPVMGFFEGPVRIAFVMMVVEALRKGRKVELNDLGLAGRRLMGLTFGFWILGILIGLGFSFLFVPGFVMATWWMFALPLMAETRLGLGAAMRESKRLVTWRGFFAHFPLALLQGLMVLGALGTTAKIAAAHWLLRVPFAALLAALNPIVSVPIAVAYANARRLVPGKAAGELAPPGEERPAPPPPALPESSPTRVVPDLKQPSTPDVRP